MVLLRVEFGVLSRGKMGLTEVVAEYLRLGRANEVRMNAVTLIESTKLVIRIRREGPRACVAGLPVVGWVSWTFNCMCKSL